MTAKQKNVLLNMTYYTLSAVTIIFCVLFMIFLATQSTGLYQQIMYYILTSLIVIFMALDIIFTAIKKNKYITGIFIYVLTLVTIALGCVLYLVMNVDGAIPQANLFSYMGMMSLSYMPMIMLIVAYCVGEKLVSNSSRISKRKANAD